MATNDGSLSHPSYLVLDGAALAATTADYGEDVECAGFEVAVIEAVCSQQWSLYILGTADPTFDGSSEPPDLYDNTFTKLQKENNTANADLTLLVDIRGLRWLRVSIYNTSGSASTATLRVTLR